FHRFMQKMAQIRVETGENFFASIDKCRFDAKAMEYVCEFNSNIPATRNGNRFRQFSKMECFIGADAIFMAGESFRHAWMPTCRDQYLVSRDMATVFL